MAVFIGVFCDAPFGNTYGKIKEFVLRVCDKGAILELFLNLYTLTELIIDLVGAGISGAASLLF